MKKTLVAIAALAAVGAASAQSSVTLYGRIDASIGSVKTTTGGVTNPARAAAGPIIVNPDGTTSLTTTARAYGDPGVQIRSGGHTGSRWGLRGSEDLGGGLKANFTLEQGFNIDNGADAAAGLGFSRQAFVGLSGGFGSLNIGRQYDIVDNSFCAHDPMGCSGYSAVAALAGAAGAVGDNIVRQDNSVMYTTPNMGGFSATAMWAPGENKTAGASAGKNMGIMASYANGPLNVGGGYQSNKATGATAATVQTILGVSYDMGVAKLYGQYATGKVKSAGAAANYEDKGFNVGVLVPVGAARIQVGYAKEDTDNRAGVELLSSKAFGLMAQYDLSKRTYVYAAYRNLQNDPAGANNTVKTTSYGLGLVHNF